MTDTILDLIRHGEPVGGRLYRGHGVDDALSEKGWAQMWAAVGDQAPWNRIVSSPLVRCREFAAALAERHGLPVQVDMRFREVGFGAWEGRAREDVEQNSTEEYAAFYRDPVNHRPPGAEALAHFVQRVVDAANDVVKDHYGEHVLLVAHAGVIRAMVAHALQSDLASLYRIRVDNAGISRIRYSNTGACLDFHNSTLRTRHTHLII
ncbi:MAG: alpha-ribazole phosphatase family protein [Pseudomonadota bacterium]|nr:MAG: alpha-ribazole phosphatase family protein [Pseudomonadota bacterium]